MAGSGKRPTHRIQTIIKRKGSSDKIWANCGVGFPHRDSGFTLILNTLPRDPKAEIVIRPIKPKVPAPDSTRGNGRGNRSAPSEPG